jgi:GT2 family glycosyltransferase
MALTIGAVIPTRYHPPQLSRLLDVCEADGVRVALMESERYDHQIYRMWNVGRFQLEALGCQYIAVLNDDIEILPGTLQMMAAALDPRRDIAPSAHAPVAVVYPDPRPNSTHPRSVVHALTPTEGTWGAGGMTGFCFMLNNALPLPHFDEGYHWWYGDDAFEEGVRRAGYLVARIDGLPIDHVANGSASRDWDRLAPLVLADRARWQAAHA